MEIVSSEEFNSIVAPLFDRGLTTRNQKKYKVLSVSQTFDYLKIISNNYLYGSTTWFNIEPIELRRALFNSSLHLGDDFLYLSFKEHNFNRKSSYHFKFSIRDSLNEELYSIKYQAEKLINRSFTDILVYSPKGLWAALLEMDCYGTLGMTKSFLERVRSIYPQLDEELDRQLLAFIGWCNDDPHSPDVWEYIPGDTTACTGWCKGLMEYLCRRDISDDSENSNVDLIDIYRNIKV